MRRFLLAAAAVVGVCVAAAALSAGMDDVATATTTTPTPTPTVSPYPHGHGEFTNLSGTSINTATVTMVENSFNATGMYVSANAAGCGAPAIISEQYTNNGAPVPMRLYTTTTVVQWPAACVDPGDMFAVDYTGVFFMSGAPTAVLSNDPPLPTATPTLTATSTPALVTATFTNDTGLPANVLHLVTLDTGTAFSVQSSPPGCPAPAVLTSIATVSVPYVHPLFGLIYVDVPAEFISVLWPSTCADPGDAASVEVSTGTSFIVASFAVESAGTPTATPTATPVPAGFIVTFTNGTGVPADGVDIASFVGLPSSVVVNAPGCPAPTVNLVTGPIITIEVDPGFPITGPTYTLEVRWPSPCADPGESVQVSFATVPYAAVGNFLPGSPGPGPTDYVALDCDTATAGIQDDCTIGLGETSVDVDVVYVSSFSTEISGLQFTVSDPDTSRLDPPALPVGILYWDSNPDFNEAILGTAAFDCGSPPPDNDDGSGGPGTARSRLGCYKAGAGNGAPVTVGVPVRLGTVHYDIPSAADPGSITLALRDVALYDWPGISELGSCSPPITNIINCFGATITLAASPGIAKIPDGNAANADLSVPKANLWLCQAPAVCGGPGEGDLRVVEHASNVFSDYDNDGIPDASDPDIAGTGLSNTELGLGAYEFSVEYDNFVIQSVNPCDIVFGAGGAGSVRGLVDELNSSSPANADCAPDPGPGSNGTCTMSLVLENVVHFGCVTNGQAQGPFGDFDLASLILIPHPDLANDIFPGNDNGVITVIKDNGCELADRLGHPVAGSVNGGLTPTCGDLAITVRILEGDMNLDCFVDVTDEQLISFRYGSFFGSLDYQKWFDLEPALHDLDIDIKDLQKVFGRDQSSCQVPIPDQPPADPPAPFGD